jgi:hypothetical protein
MLLYYRGRDLVITNEVVDVRRPFSHRYEIDKLSDLHVVRHRLDPTITAAAYTAVGALIIVVVSWRLLTSVEAWLLALLLVGAPIAVFRVCLLCRPRIHELRATYEGQEVVLYATEDATAFAQVRRAMIRVRQRTTATPNSLVVWPTPNADRVPAARRAPGGRQSPVNRRRPARRVGAPV